MGGTGWYRYFFPAHTLLYLLFPNAIMFLTGFVRKELYKKILLIIPVALIIFQFFYLIFLSDTSFVVKRIRNDMFTEVLSKIDSSKNVIFYNAIEAAVFLKGSNYSQYFSMDNFIIAGNKNILSKPDADFIFIGNFPIGTTTLPCYDKSAVGQYFLYKRINNCNK